MRSVNFSKESIAFQWQYLNWRQLQSYSFFQINKRVGRGAERVQGKADRGQIQVFTHRWTLGAFKREINLQSADMLYP